MALVSNKDQLEIIDHFVTDLESSLGVRQTMISFASLWDASPPKEANSQSLQEYMETVMISSGKLCIQANLGKRHAATLSFTMTTIISISFRLDFERKFSKTPYVSAPVQWQWFDYLTISILAC